MIGAAIANMGEDGMNEPTEGWPAYFRIRNASALVLLGAFLASCTTAPNVDHLVRHDDDLLHMGDELLVLDPTPAYLAALPEMGLAIREVTDLGSMGSKLYHMDIVDGRHPLHIRDHHQSRFPNVTVDVHHHFEHHATRKKRAVDKNYTARGATKWKKAGARCGRGIRIGIIDSGVDLKHPALKGVAHKHRSFKLKGQKPPNAIHGTAVTTILAGRGAWGGLLPYAEYRTANIFHRGKRGKNVGSTKAIILALDWLLKEKVSVINMSIGGAPNALLRKAIQFVRKRGIIIVASAGNSGPFSKKKSYPAAYKEVIAVTALDKFERNAKFASSGDYLEFATPGVNIWTAVPRGGRAMSGTSFAAPIFAGYAAAALKMNGVKGLKAVRNYFRKHSKDKAKKGWDKYTGWGLVQLKRPC